MRILKKTLEVAVYKGYFNFRMRGRAEYIPKTRIIQIKMSKKYTLKFTLISSFCGLILVNALFLSVVTSYEVGGFIREELRLRLTDIVNIMASQIDGDLHSQIQTSADEQGVAFRQLQDTLLEMRQQGTEISNTYTMRKMDDGQIEFVIDLTRKGASPTGTIYNSPTDTLKNALNAVPGITNVYTESVPSSDDLGIWLSAYAPIFTSSGKIDGIVGIDVSAKNVIEHELYYKIMVYVLSTAVGLLMLPLGFFIARSVRQPLAQLTVEMEKIRNFDLDGDIKITSRIHEINSMAQQLDSMKRGLRSFKKYVPADLVRELIELGVDAKLGGEKKNLTIFFSDIANFTTMSEKLSPESLVTFLSEYLNVMNLSLLENYATVDKYIGDSVMAFFGAPRFMDKHAVNSCLAALACQQHIEQLNQSWKARGLELAFNTRIGIHTGDVVVANIGSDARMNYTIIGDSVNLASRIESANKFYDTKILISETTYQEVKDYFVTRLIDDVMVIGKANSIRIYELIAHKDTVANEKLQQIERYQDAFQLYTKGLFAEAISILEELISKTPSDRVTQLLFERCQNYIAVPPALDWQGHYILPYK